MGQRLLQAAAALLAMLALAPMAGFAQEPRTFYVEDIKGAMHRHIAARVDDDGIFRMKDRVTGELLELQFVKIHDPVRVIDDRTYFACTDFHVVGEPDKLYDLDFWLRPAGDVLEVYEERVHKEPRRSLLWGWYKHPRYTFVDDEVVSLY